jgi:hypothetical protein
VSAAQPSTEALAIRALFGALYEYLLIVAPVGIYVGLEALHSADAAVLASTPEWAIATIFLAFQGNALHKHHMRLAGRTASGGLIAFFTLGVTVVAAVNAYRYMEHPTTASLFVRQGLLLVTSVVFFVLVWSAKLEHYKHSRNSHV